MPLLEEYYDRDEKEPEDAAKKILFDIFADLTDRRGIRQAWDAVGEDIQEEILAANLRIIKKHLH